MLVFRPLSLVASGLVTILYKFFQATSWMPTVLPSVLSNCIFQKKKNLNFVLETFKKIFLNPLPEVYNIFRAGVP